MSEARQWRGVMVAMFVLDTLGMNDKGGYSLVEWEPFEVANRIVRITRGGDWADVGGVMRVRVNCGRRWCGDGYAS